MPAVSVLLHGPAMKNSLGAARRANLWFALGGLLLASACGRSFPGSHGADGGPGGTGGTGGTGGQGGAGGNPACTIPPPQSGWPCQVDALQCGYGPRCGDGRRELCTCEPI